MASLCRIEVRQGNTALYTPVKITSRQTSFSRKLPPSLIDSGANICHMTYPMWLHIGYGKACFAGNPAAFKRNGISTADEICFEKLPLVPHISVIGGGTNATVYKFQIERLELLEGEKTSANSIVLENITTNLIDGDEPEFIIGWNIIKYLKVNYDPALPFDINVPNSEKIIKNYYEYELTDTGRVLLEYDRHTGFNNDMTSMFEYSRSI